MSQVLSETEEKCRCGRCRTYARITKWSCGCVQVRIYNDASPCSTCSNFSGMRKHCGRSGEPSQGHR